MAENIEVGKSYEFLLREGECLPMIDSGSLVTVVEDLGVNKMTGEREFMVSALISVFEDELVDIEEKK